MGVPLIHDRLITSMSFSHFAELIAVEDALKRTFYEIECVRGNWSQIVTGSNQGGFRRRALMEENRIPGRKIGFVIKDKKGTH